MTALASPALTPETLAAAARRRVPALFPRAVAGWPAVGTWTIDGLAARFPDRRLPVEMYPEGDYLRQPTTVEFPLARYAELAGLVSERYYLAEVGIEKRLPELLGEVPAPAGPAADRTLYRVLFAGRDTVSGLHLHPVHQALLCQVTGTKRVLCAPPSSFASLGFAPVRSRRFNIASLDPRRPGAAAGFAEFTLRPGDALFLPVHCAHFVEGAGESLSVTFFWRARRGEWALDRAAAHAFAGFAVHRYGATPVAKVLERFFGYRVS